MQSFPAPAWASSHSFLSVESHTLLERTEARLETELQGLPEKSPESLDTMLVTSQRACPFQLPLSQIPLIPKMSPCLRSPLAL